MPLPDALSDVPPPRLVVLGTGGTIAGIAAAAGGGYHAAQLPVATLLRGLPGAGRVLLAEQVVQLDSKDMDHTAWDRLAVCIQGHLRNPAVDGIVVTHGTDTIEETAYFLQEALAPAKPVVLTCAMRPATDPAADGPQNLADALAVAGTSSAGVMVVCAGTVHAADAVQKLHTWRLDAFDSGPGGPLGWVEQGRVRWSAGPPAAGPPRPDGERRGDPATWPRVEIVSSHAGADGAVVDALLRDPATGAPLRGLVVASTGNGTVHRALEAALARARAAGIHVLRATRCAYGRILPAGADALPHASALTPAKARIRLMLDIMRGEV